PVIFFSILTGIAGLSGVHLRRWGRERPAEPATFFATFFVAAFFAAGRLPGVFFATAFFVGAFLAGAFFAATFLVAAFLVGAFFAAAFFVTALPAPLRWSEAASALALSLAAESFFLAAPRRLLAALATLRARVPAVSAAFFAV